MTRRANAENDEELSSVGFELTLTMSKKVGFHHPPSFGHFFAAWISFLQGSVFPQYIVQNHQGLVNESATLSAFAADHEPEFERLSMQPIRSLISQRYVRTHTLGRTLSDDRVFVSARTKQATDYLRCELGVDPAIVIGIHDDGSGESGKPNSLSGNVFSAEDQGPQRLAALLVLLYRVRCNLFHAVKGYRTGSDRPELLTSLSAEILVDMVGSWPP